MSDKNKSKFKNTFITPSVIKHKSTKISLRYCKDKFEFICTEKENKT